MDWRITEKFYESSKLGLMEVGIFDIESSILMFVDQSSKNTACALFSKEGTFKGFILIENLKMKPVQFKVEMRRYFAELFETIVVEKIFYEEAFNNYKNEEAYQTMILIRDTFREFEYEYNISTEPLPNTFWKKRLLFPKKMTASSNHKEMVKSYLVKNGYAHLNDYKQDVFDAIGMGVSHFKAENGLLPKSLTEKKWKPNRRFHISLDYVYISCDEDILDSVDTIENSELYDYMQHSGVEIFDINRSYDVDTNIRHYLEALENAGNKSCILMQIPDYRYYGSFLLQNGIRHEESMDLYIFAKKKTW